MIWVMGVWAFYLVLLVLRNAMPITAGGLPGCVGKFSVCAAHLLGRVPVVAAPSSLQRCLVMPIVCLGLNHRTAPVTVRERFALPEGELPRLLEALRDGTVAGEAVILSTCNRVEIYAATDEEPQTLLNELRAFLLKDREVETDADEVFYEHAGEPAVQHLFKVASGLNSMVLGETEILGQLKVAYQLALAHKATGGRLNKVFQKAFNVAKQIRTETNIQRGSVSVANVAVELAGKIFDELHDRTVMVIGAGDTSEKTARALLVAARAA